MGREKNLPPVSSLFRRVSFDAEQTFDFIDYKPKKANTAKMLWTKMLPEPGSKYPAFANLGKAKSRIVTDKIASKSIMENFFITNLFSDYWTIRISDCQKIHFPELDAENGAS